MKILVISVFSNHFFNWILQLKNTHHEIYWLDVNDSNTYVERIDFVHQIVKWKRKIDYPGRYWIKKNTPLLSKKIENFNQREFKEIFREKLDEIKPDLVQSHEMFSSCVPIADIMKRHPRIKWLYLAWGNDLFFYEKIPEKRQEIQNVMERLDYIFADCKRDLAIARKNGFKGTILGSYPTGGGYNLKEMEARIRNFDNRNVILVKGYQHHFGRCNNILKALLKIEKEIKDFQVVIFAATKEVFEFLNGQDKNSTQGWIIKGSIGREEVLDLMGKSLIYVGNSISDGTPNTLLEAIIMEVFPIQSNPGGATAELIEDGKNGFLINDPEDDEKISELLRKAVADPQLMKTAISYNSRIIKPTLDRAVVQEKVLNKYGLIEKDLQKNQ